MLYGIYLVSMEPRMAGEEFRQLAFNFSSLQIYELLMSVVAIVLARRMIWYDSALLLNLENLLVFVPFILIVQAAFLTSQTMLGVSLIAGGMAAGRFTMLSRRFPGFPAQSLLTLLGMVLLGLNLFLPRFYRDVVELDNDSWTNGSRLFWLLLLPVIAWAGNLIRPVTPAVPQGPARPWLPLFMLGSWLAGTAVHLASIDYVNSQAFNWWEITPLIWIGFWVLSAHAKHVLPGGDMHRPLLWSAALFITLLATDYHNAHLFLALNLLNALLFFRLWRTDARPELPFHLLGVSLVAVIAAMPETLGLQILPNFTRERCILGSIGAYLIVLLSARRSAWSSLVAAGLVAYGTAWVFAGIDYLEQFAFQNGLLFFLFDGLRWKDSTRASRALQLAACLAWVSHAFGWGYYTEGAVASTVTLSGALVLAVLGLLRLLQGQWSLPLMIASSILVLVSGPTNYFFALIRITPTGYLTVLGAFVLFGIGTLLALSKPKWEPLNEKPV